MTLKPQVLVKDVQLLVEGKVPEGFFSAIAEHLGLKNLQIQNFGGVTQLKPFLKWFVRLPGFPRVTSIGIVRDAEQSAEGAFASVKNALKEASLPIPSRVRQRCGRQPAVSVMILPGNADAGMLETLLWETIQSDDTHTCINSFFECVEDVLGEPVRSPDKARVTAFLATRPNPHLSIGSAANRGYLDFDHAALEPVRSFLQDVTESHSTVETFPPRHG